MKNATNFSLAIICAVAVILVLVTGINAGSVLNPTDYSKSISYPIDTPAVTTQNRTIRAIAVPLASPKLLPSQAANYSQYGYGKWEYDPGTPYEKRLDLMQPGYGSAPVANAASLLNFFTISDIHITDKESPAQGIYYGYKWGLVSGYTPAMLYSTQFLDATIQTINSINKQRPLDFGISLGDDTNSGQYNELRWFIDVLDGKKISPDSGAKDDPVLGPLNDYQDEFQAAGLDKSIPWYSTIGNHDRFWMGLYAPDDYIKNAITGNTVLDIGNIFTNASGIKTRGYYMGVIDGKTPYGDVIGAGPVANFTFAPTVPADSARRFLLRNEWVSEFFNSSSSPVGHGFNQTDKATGFACYTFEPKSDIPIKVIVLDDTQKDDDPSIGTSGHGSLDAERYNWLVNELELGQSEGKLMVIAAHIPIGVKLPADGLASLMSWSKYSAKTDAEILAKLHTYPNLILWVSGHRHSNTVTAQKSPDPTRPELGFWEVETPSLREFPQQFRTFEIVRNSDDTISIFTTDVDPSVANNSLAGTSRAYAIAAKQVFNYSIDFEPSGAYNAELVKQLSPEMQAKIRGVGKAIAPKQG